MDSKGIAQSVIVAAGLIGGLGLLGSQLSDGINAFVDRDRVVTVKGLATASVIADEVLWPISFRVLGNDLQEVYRQAEAQMQEARERRGYRRRRRRRHCDERCHAKDGEHDSRYVARSGVVEKRGRRSSRLGRARRAQRRLVGTLRAAALARAVVLLALCCV